MDIGGGGSCSPDAGEYRLCAPWIVSQFLAAATAQARLGAIRSVHLQLGFPDPLKPLPRLNLALEGVRRRKGPISKRRPVMPRIYVGEGTDRPSSQPLVRALNCALQLFSSSSEFQSSLEATAQSWGSGCDPLQEWRAPLQASLSGGR